MRQNGVRARPSEAVAGDAIHRNEDSMAESASSKLRVEPCDFGGSHRVLPVLALDENFASEADETVFVLVVGEDYIDLLASADIE